MALDWHSAPLSGATIIDANFKKTQNVRRFLRAECGDAFTFDRALMAWIDAGGATTLSDIAQEWRQRQGLTR